MKANLVNPLKTVRRVLTGGILILGLSMGAAVAAVNSGSDCALTPPGPKCLGNVTYSVNTVVSLPPDGILHYGSLTVNGGVTLSFNRNTLNTPVFILASGDVTING